VNTINAQVFAFDAKLTQFERNTAKVMAERLRQSNSAFSNIWWQNSANTPTSALTLQCCWTTR
jgi:hypothetical protein